MLSAIGAARGVAKNVDEFVWGFHGCNLSEYFRVSNSMRSKRNALSLPQVNDSSDANRNAPVIQD
jgi:hypothetical protein